MDHCHDVRNWAPWRDVPARYGPWQTVHGLRRRQHDGTWQRILTGLQDQADANGLITWEVSVDSTVARAHQHAAGARKGAAKRSTGGGVDVGAVAGDKPGGTSSRAAAKNQVSAVGRREAS